MYIYKSKQKLPWAAYKRKNYLFIFYRLEKKDTAGVNDAPEAAQSMAISNIYSFLCLEGCSTGKSRWDHKCHCLPNGPFFLLAAVTGFHTDSTGNTRQPFKAAQVKPLFPLPP